MNKEKYTAELEMLPERIFVPGYMANEVFFRMHVDAKTDPDSFVSMDKNSFIEHAYARATDKECVANIILLMNMHGRIPDA